ncbi:SDR family NAD(P)-dependent oxidoreductase [Phenylobacterium aquaticum]|uniref:SDR family NAD(P)-dependent oxidoreductase n=1 Tax=Phenylobacterium aquaticum TaxID=1763816 RepID=UPI001F5DD04F|nr:SDR family NAD(P)-dependent oxidoreductase [Phenylobacterium aquaticum]MCI3132699.1 SDR family NAD(P)-dependent oxidoreductase [Phenylobacterium aquaticum]
MTKRVIILGALSAVAVATARLYAAQGAALTLVARDAGELALLAADLKVRGASAVTPEVLDLAQADPSLLKRWVEARGGCDLVLIAYGTLTDQARAETDLAYGREQLATNFGSAAGWAMAAAAALEAQGHGALVVLGSVAGDRGRGSNYVYGAAKAGLGVLVQGLAHRLAGSGARAVLIKPGFIDTPMTAHLAKSGPLWSKPEAIARVIAKAAVSGGPIVYAPAYWRLILWVIRALPAALVHRTRL